MDHAFDSRAAFSAAVTEHQRSVFFHALRLCRGDEQLARDVAQKTFLKAWTARADFRGESSLRTWLLRIAHNLAINELRRAHRRREVVPEDDGDDLGSVSATAPETIDDARQREALQHAVLGLAPRQRDVTLLRLYQDLTFPEIGDVLGISAGNAKVHFHHATKNLRRQLAHGGAA
ncbi:MAG: RNA polymerase sigma factor [Deltaproteobacteria bacterium]|nr:RNA polymerase sigma factor [Deltaproteobacteria bacterium]